MIKSFAQLDTEHWFAPMMTRVEFSTPQHFLFFSTNESVPFKVKIYSHNQEIGQVTISKGNPQRFTLYKQYIITEDEKELFKTSRLGVYTKGDKPYYVNLRFSVSGELGFVSSKGKAALGNIFYAVVAPIGRDENTKNFMASILATEDNTNVIVSGYRPEIQFSTPQGSSINFNLNKGESYIIDGNGFEPDNYDSFIGSKIVADKPVTVSNGNYGGSYPGGGSDIYMDQAVPIERLGSEFALVKGEGTVGNFVENGLVVATQNNTQIFVNNIPNAIATINEGEYFIISDKYYQLAGDLVYNMYVKTSKSAYLYQLTAGSAEGDDIETGDLTYIPPLNCFLPKIVGEIGSINEHRGVGATGRYQTFKKTKLDIITQTGADVRVNGMSPSAAEGPYGLLGNPDWVTYSIRDVKGNITVTSTKAVMTGIIGGDGVSGFAGFFAGVSTVPVVIKKGGPCIPGISLEVNPDFDSYQWQLNGMDIIGAITNNYTPALPGNYAVTVTRGTCLLTTAPIKILNCIKLTSSNYLICQLLKITPKLTFSPQALNPGSVEITKIPERGIIQLDKTTGIITYTPYPNVYGVDTFTYKFCGDDEFKDCEEVTVTVDVEKLTVQSDTLLTCNANGTGIFNLTLANIKESIPVSKTYYKTLAGAESEDPVQEILNFTAYSSSGETIFIVAKTSDGCSEIAKVTLDFLGALNVSLYNSANCDNDFDGFINIKLADITKAILPSNSGLTVKYYTNNIFALAGGPNNLADDFSYSTSITIYMRVDSQNCSPTIVAIPLKVGSKIPSKNTSVTVSDCNFDIDSSTSVDLSKYLQMFTADSSANVKYYTSLQNAQYEKNEISNPVAVNSGGIYYLRFSKIGFCPAIGILTLNLPQASANLKDEIICPGTLTVLDAGNSFAEYLWSTGEKTSSIQVGVGTYYVDLTSNNGCTYRQKVKVTEAEPVIITSIKLLENIIEINASGGVMPFKYSIDGINYQDSNIFTNVPRGPHTAYVISSDGCKIAEKDFVTISFPKVITPNGDGKNDVLDYSELSLKNDVSFEIFDRYGSLVFKSKDGIFIWNGKKNGKVLATGTYWCILKWTEPDTQIPVVYSTWILLKNR